MAAALRSSVDLVLRSSAAAPRLSPSAGAASANTRRTMHYDYSGRRYDASAVAELGPGMPGQLPGLSWDKYDGYFAFAAAIIAAGMFELIEGDYFGLGKMNTRPPRMSRSRR